MAVVFVLGLDDDDGIKITNSVFPNVFFGLAKYLFWLFVFSQTRK
jgi:hypothetical protein